MVTYDVYCGRRGNTRPEYIGRREDYLEAVAFRDSFVEKLGVSYIEEAVIISESKIIKNYNFYG